MMKYSILDDENHDDENHDNNVTNDMNTNNNYDTMKDQQQEHIDSDDIGILNNDNMVTIHNGDAWKKSFPVGIIGIISCLLLLLLLARRPRYVMDNSSSNVNFNGITNIAFGSCTSYDLREMNIWSDAIIPSSPQAWIWTGDMVYLDDPNLNCDDTSAEQISSSSWQEGCNCTATWMSSPPSSCHAGDLEYAESRWLEAIENTQYNSFLDYICPAARALGIFPPPGNDPELCNGPIFGVYDDHDFGWNNGNKRLPTKSQYKNLFLDAIGERQDSPRRGNNRGLWYKETLNKGMKDAEIDIFLLDERFERDTISCDSRRDYCKDAVLKDDVNLYSKSEKAFCQDFLYDDSFYNEHSGSCCDKDEKIFFGWCKLESSKSSIFYREACDVSYPLFGQRALVLDDDGNLKEPDSIEYLDLYQSSPFCEVLGREQRKWLRQAVKDSTAVVKLFISSSVLLENPQKRKCGVNKDNGEDIDCYCGGDNLDCYRVAQQELLYIIAQENNGCNIVITGDYHFSDIKALNPGDQLYSSYYFSKDNLKPIYQVMASGMSTSTGHNFTCDDYRLDPLKLRTHPECDFVRGPSFGMIQFDVSNKNENHHSFFDSFRPVDSPDLPSDPLSKQQQKPNQQKSSTSSMVIDKIRLRIMDGSIGNKIRLETVVDRLTCQQIT